MTDTAFGEEKELTQADLDRWKREEAEEFGFSGHDETYDEARFSRRPARIANDYKKPKHVFAECNIIGCKICAGS